MVYAFYKHKDSAFDEMQCSTICPLYFYVNQAYYYIMSVWSVTSVRTLLLRVFLNQYDALTEGLPISEALFLHCREKYEIVNQSVFCLEQTFTDCQRILFGKPNRPYMNLYRLNK